MPKMLGKLGKVLGTSSDSISERVLQGGVSSTPGEFSAFWTSMEREPPVCAAFLADVVKFLLEYEKDPSKAEKVVRKGAGSQGHVQSLPQFLRLLTQTVDFIQQFVDFDTALPELTDALDKFEAYRRQHPQIRHMDSKNVVSNLKKKMQNGRDQTIVQMLVECSTLDSLQEMMNGSAMGGALSMGASASMGNAAAAAATGNAPSGTAGGGGQGDDDDEHKDYPFLFTALKKQLRGAMAGHIFDEILKILGVLPLQLGNMPVSTQNRVLALLLMLREFLIEDPTSDVAWLKKAAATLHVFYKWPRPYGIVARDMLEFLSLEMRAPGANLRERIIFENLDLHPYFQHHVSIGRTPSTAGARCTFPIIGEKLVHVLFDGSVAICRTHRALLADNYQRTRRTTGTAVSGATAAAAASSQASSSAAGTEAERIAQLRRHILTHIFDCDFCISDTTADCDDPALYDPLNLRNKADEEVARWYVRAMDVLERAKGLPLTVPSCTSDIDRLAPEFHKDGTGSAEDQAGTNATTDNRKGNGNHDAGETGDSVSSTAAGGCTSSAAASARGDGTGGDAISSSGLESKDASDAPTNRRGGAASDAPEEVREARQRAVAEGMAGSLCKQYREAALSRILRDILPDREFSPRRTQPVDMIAAEAAANMVGGDGRSTTTSLTARPVSANYHNLENPLQAAQAALQGSAIEEEKESADAVTGADGSGVTGESSASAGPRPQRMEAPASGVSQPLPFNAVSTPRSPDLHFDFFEFGGRVPDPLLPEVDDSGYVTYRGEVERLLAAMRHAVDTAPPDLLQDQAEEDAAAAEQKDNAQAALMRSGSSGSSTSAASARDDGGFRGLAGSSKRRESITVEPSQVAMVDQSRSLRGRLPLTPSMAGGGATRSGPAPVSPLTATERPRMTQARKSQYIPISSELPWRPRERRSAIVKVVLMGSNLVLHHYVCALVALRKQHKALFDQVEFRTFVVPAGRNDLGKYLCSTDKWFTRHIYNSFASSLPICPRYTDDLLEAWAVENAVHETVPVRVLREILTDYVRQAVQILPVCVFELLCWSSEDAVAVSPDRDSRADPTALLGERPPDFVVPFVGSVEIGLNAHAALHRMNTGEEGGLATLLAQKTFAYTPLELLVSYAPSSMRGQINEIPNQITETLASLTLSNLPLSCGDRETEIPNLDGRVPNAPNMRWMVLNYRYGRGNLGDQSLRKPRKTARDVEAIMDAMRDPDSCGPAEHVGALDVSVTKPSDGFHILVDGCVMGPVKKIRAQPCQAWGDERVVIPLTTYFPVNA